MSEYPRIVTTLWEFGLITEEQSETALADYDREYAETEERAKAFEADWKKRTPWWRRQWHEFFGGGWRYEFYKSEHER